MLAGTGFQLGACVFFAPLRVPDDAGNGSNGQTMPGFAIHAKDADGVGWGEQFEIQRKGVNGKALLQKCAGLKNVTHVSITAWSEISVSAGFSHPPLEDPGGVIKRKDVVITVRFGARVQRIAGAAAKAHHGGHAFGGLEHASSQLVDARGVEFILGERIAIDPLRFAP